MAGFEAKQGGYTVSDDPARLDLDLVCGFLAGSYWAANTPRETIRRSVENSHAFGLYRGGEQAGFARAITDYARFAYLADVFVLEAHRSRGLGAWLVECVLGHPELRGVRKWMLTTRDARGFYEQFGFTNVEAPEWMMERR